MESSNSNSTKCTIYHACRLQTLNMNIYVSVGAGGQGGKLGGENRQDYCRSGAGRRRWRLWSADLSAGEAGGGAAE